MEFSQYVLLVMNIEHTSLLQSTIERLFGQSYSLWRIVLLYNKDLDIENIKTKYKNNKNIIWKQHNDHHIANVFNETLECFLKDDDYSHLCFINDHDKYYPNFIKFLLDGKRDFVYGNYHKHRDYIIESKEYKDKEDLIQNYQGLCNTMWSKIAIKKIGLLDILKEEVALYDYYIRTFDVLTKNEIKYIKIALNTCLCEKYNKFKSSLFDEYHNFCMKMIHDPYFMKRLEKWNIFNKRASMMIELIDIDENIEYEELKMNSELNGYIITLLGYKNIRPDGTRHTNWFPWNRFKDVYETIGYKCEWTTLDKLHRKDEKRVFVTWNEPTSLELVQSGKVHSNDIIFQKLTSLGKGMEKDNWTSNPKEWCKAWNWPIYRTFEYLYDCGINIYGFGCKTRYDEFPEKKRICEKLKDRIFWISWGGTPFNWEQIKNAQPIMDNFSSDITFVGSKWGAIGRGNVDAWEKYIEPLQKTDYKFQQYGGIGNKMVSDDEMVELLQSSKLCPIIHAPSWQAEYGIQDRFYTVFLSGRFGICDNMGIIDLFGIELEDICSEDPKLYYQKSKNFLKFPQKQLPFIKFIQHKIKTKFNFYKQWEYILNSDKIQKTWNFTNSSKEMIKNIGNIPYVSTIIDYDTLISKKYNYINELLLFEGRIKEYYLYKIKKQLKLHNCNQYDELIHSNEFINHFHNASVINADFYSCCNFLLNTNYKLMLNKNISKGLVKNYHCYHDINEITVDNKLKLNQKLFTYILIVKNRPERAMTSIKSLVKPETYKYCDFIIVEDVSNHCLDLSNFQYKHFIKHYLIDTELIWTRSGTLNYGIKRANTPYIVGWDADFIFNDRITIDIDKFIRTYKPMNVIGLSSLESFFSDISSFDGFPCIPYGYMWIYNVDVLNNVKGFNTQMIGHGFEERELEARIKNKYGIGPIKTSQIHYVVHMSHNSKLRGDGGGNNRDIYFKTLNTKLKLDCFDDNYKLLSSYVYMNYDIIRCGNNVYQLFVNDKNKLCVYDLHRNKMIIKNNEIVYSSTRDFFWDYTIISEKQIVIYHKHMYLDLSNKTIQPNNMKNDIIMLGKEDDIFNSLHISNFDHFYLNRLYNDGIQIIGPADHIQNMNNLHNSLVCICNTSINLLGKKINKVDIYFHCVSMCGDSGGTIDVNKLIKYGCQHIVFVYPMLKIDEKTTFYNIGLVKDYIGLEHINFRGLKLWMINKDTYLQLEKDLDSRPNTGFLMNYMMINKFCSSYKLYIKGFSFFKTNYALGVRDVIDEIECKDNNRTLANNRMKKSGWHDQEKQISYFQKFIKNKPNVIIDNVLHDVLEGNIIH